MPKDVQEVFTPDNLWRARLNAWKTDVLFFHEVGGSILVDKYVRGRWVKTPEARIHLVLHLVGQRPGHIYRVYNGTEAQAGYRDRRVRSYAGAITFGTNIFGNAAFKVEPLVNGVELPGSKEPVRCVRASGDVQIPGYPLLVFPEACSGDFCD